MVKSFSPELQEKESEFDKIPIFKLIPKNEITGYFVNFSDECSLLHLDPWDLSIRKFLKPSWNPMKNCIPSVRNIAKLEDRKIVINRSLKMNNSTCSARCVFAYTDRRIRVSSWVHIDEVSPALPCDVIEVQCTSLNYVYYNYLFSHTVPIPDKDKRQNKGDRPNVLIFVLDSTSFSNFARSMPKTRDFFLGELNAVEFKHLNRVDYNSVPNSKAFLVGKQMKTKLETPMNLFFPSDYDYNPCEVNADNDSYIAFDFQKAGYITCQSEESTVFGYNKCQGFKKNPTDHYWRPFSLRTIGNEAYKEFDFTLMDFLYRRSCLENYHHNFRYMDSFLRTYPEKSKFLMSWFNGPAHGDINGLFRADSDFYNFFKSHQEELKDSYVFFMGDHGIHYTDIAHTEVGHAELNNPFLIVSLPKGIKNKEVIETMKKNSKELISHFDIHATLVDIVDDYLDPQEIGRLPVHGSSLFKNLPQPRSCNTLHIPFEFCGCQVSLTSVVNPKLGIRIGKTIVTHMNKHVEYWFSRGICADLSLDENHGVSLEKIEAKQKVDFFKVKLRVRPGDVDYSGYVWIDPYYPERLSIVGQLLRKDFILDKINCTTVVDAKIYCICT
ncbi:hypothetical protein FO519_005072 [Halicephalobus sp. NKZ332]|nr:hypothetical protein FO519_005072 [Halicephalobus sp. NKZ332]